MNLRTRNMKLSIDYYVENKAIVDKCKFREQCIYHLLDGHSKEQFKFK